MEVENRIGDDNEENDKLWQAFTHARMAQREAYPDYPLPRMTRDFCNFVVEILHEDGHKIT